MTICAGLEKCASLQSVSICYFVQSSVDIKISVMNNHESLLLALLVISREIHSSPCCDMSVSLSNYRRTSIQGGEILFHPMS